MHSMRTIGKSAKPACSLAGSLGKSCCCAVCKSTPYALGLCCTHAAYAVKPRKAHARRPCMVAHAADTSPMCNPAMIGCMKARCIIL